ncbi:MAG: YfcE family phosphodiesterase [Deltaproteobacteria bacterium]|nr:YfcE family phosphodiesterase [Deltaproteobacteria bacterium]
MPKQKKKRFIGLISDTHGLVRPEALRALAGAELVIHAGDIGKVEVIETLRTIAPVVAIRGNVDQGEWADEFHDTEVVEVDPLMFYVLHDLKTLDLDPAVSRFQVVISGHSHQPWITNHNGILFVNPGSAGPRRFKLPVAVARLQIDGSSIHPEIVELNV